MNKMLLLSGSTVLLLAAGCSPDLAQGNYGAEEQQWQAVISSSYSNYRPPRIAPPTIVDKASAEALEKQREEQDRSGVPAPGEDKDSVQEVTPAAAVDNAAAKSEVKDPEDKAADAKAPADKKADADAKAPADKKAAADAKAPADKKADAASDLEYEIYVVKPGDNPGSIAHKFYGKASYFELILKANPQIKDPKLIQIGSKLKIPKL